MVMMFILASVPTILSVALVKSVFSPVPPRYEDSVKISDAVPVAKVVETANSAM